MPEATGDLIGNKTANKITIVSRTLPQNNDKYNNITMEYQKIINLLDHTSNQ